MPPDRELRIATLAAASAARTERALDRVHSTVEKLASTGEPITIHAVSRRSGVSRSFIYGQPEVLAAIRELAETSASRLQATGVRSRASDASLRTRLADALDSRRELAAQLAAVQAERSALLAELRELRAEVRRLQARAARP